MEYNEIEPTWVKIFGANEDWDVVFYPWLVG